LTGESTTLVRTLQNGLRVILRESHDAPVASFWVWYRVGARNESAGLTGISHWVEHMQFKGTPSLGKGEIFREISRIGGYNNAMTSNDWTAYYETLPADRIALAISIESDRMRNSLFDPEETEAERTVILSEQQGAENSPGYQLYKEVVGTAFRNHPYGKMVIGYEHDLRSITRDDLYAHYQTAYSPNNAFVVATGDFDAPAVMASIEGAFGAIPAGESIAEVRAIEPEQLGERRVTLHRPSPTSYLRIAFRAPAGNHPDTAALLIADAVLSGAKGMGLAGGGPMGRSSRLYRALVASGLARAASSDFDFFIDPYLLMIGVTALPDSDPAAIESVVNEELGRLLEEPVSEGEFARAVKQVKAQYVYSGEGVTNQAFWLGQMELIGDYKRADTLVDEIERVTPADVQRVAKTYFAPARRTIGWLLPERDGGGTADLDPAYTGAVRFWGINGPNGAPTSKTGTRPFERLDSSNGIRLLGQAQPDDPSVTVRFRLQAGSTTDLPMNHGRAALTARSLMRGTAQRSFEAINELTDSLGASISVDPSQLFTDLRVRCLREDLPALVDLAAEIMRSPTFPETEVEKVKAELIAAIKEQDNDTRSVADRTMRSLIYPDQHPLRHRVLGDIESLAPLTAADLVTFHAAYYRPSNMTVAIVGGIDDLQTFARLLEHSFGDWERLAETPHISLVTPLLEHSDREDVAIAGKSQADIAIGLPVLSRLNSEYQALDMGNLVLGRLGLMGRLGANVRDRQGLAYYAMSSIEPGRDGSLWVARAGVDPSNIDRAIDAIRDELQRISDELISVAELEDAKSYLTGVLPLALETNDGIVSLLLSIDYFDLGLDYLDRYPEIVRSISADQIQEVVRANFLAERLAIGVAHPG
jgi:zinc protease